MNINETRIREGGGGGGEAGGEAIILYKSWKCKFRLQTNIDINSSLNKMWSMFIIS